TRSSGGAAKVTKALKNTIHERRFHKLPIMDDEALRLRLEKLKSLDGKAAHAEESDLELVERYKKLTGHTPVAYAELDRDDKQRSKQQGGTYVDYTALVLTSPKKLFLQAESDNSSDVTNLIEEMTQEVQLERSRNRDAKNEKSLEERLQSLRRFSEDMDGKRM
ncbi:hypothetical protein HDU96_009305, partial [Phlyctochytrium bullatum]